jgi:hypothetical protein
MYEHIRVTRSALSACAAASVRALRRGWDNALCPWLWRYFARGRDRGVGIVSGRGGGGVEIGQGIRCSDLGDGNVSGSGYGSKVYGCLGQFVILWESGEVTPCTT